MSHLLSVTSSPRGEYSISRTLTAQFVDAWKQSHPEGTVVERDLLKTTLPFVDPPWIAGAYTPAEQHSEEMKLALKISDELIAELKAADHIVIGTSMYNFSLPANLKAWIDQVVRINRTFTSSYEGLLKGKKATVIIASGGVYTPGSPTENYNAESGYLKQVLGFIGITDLEIVLAGGTSAVAMGKMPQNELVAQFTPAVTSAAH